MLGWLVVVKWRLLFLAVLSLLILVVSLVVEHVCGFQSLQLSGPGLLAHGP